MSPRADPEVAHVIIGYDGAVRSIRTRVHGFVRAMWGGIEQLRDADVTRFVKHVVPTVTGGQRQIAALTDVYLAALEQSALGVKVRPRGIPNKLVTTDAMRGVPAEQVYRRPAITVYTALSKGMPFDQAMRSGLARALAISATDLQLARTHTMRYIGSSNQRISGYRRVPGGGNVCALCDEASAEIYHAEDLLPIHAGCSCGVEPIFTTVDPGTPPEPDAPQGQKDEGASYAVHDHGELGPVLAIAGQTFTGPDDLDS